MKLIANEPAVRCLRPGWERLAASPALRRVAGEGLWVVIGQAMSAAGLLLGGRVLTGLVPPDVFGTVSLLLGVIAFATGTFCSPHLQATLRFYPDLAREGRLAALHALVAGTLRRTGGVLAAIILLGGAVASWAAGISYWAFVALAVLLLAEVFRTFETNLLSAARRQRPFALWQALESWARPGAAVLAVVLWGATPQAVLAGYVAGTAALLVLFRPAAGPAGPAASDPRLAEAIRRYALPLAPLALVGWVSALSDRYLVGGLLGLEAAGLYAAAYGLVSRPLLMLGGVVELTLRPGYYEAVAAGDRDRERRLFRVWLWTTAGAAALCVALVAAFSGPIVSLLLGERYRAGAGLLPWIAGGYALLVTAYVFEKACYAHKRTGWVTIGQVAGAIASIVAEVPLIWAYGLEGAAFAVPVYYGVQAAVTLLASRRSVGAGGRLAT